MRARTFINAASTISHQPTFGASGFWQTVSRLEPGHELIQPAYRDYIDPALLRRMSKILRMGVACSVSALEQSGTEQPSAIIVGTGLGCLLDTEKFLNNFLTLDGLLPPTSFILSTHNTVAGQISLSLGCHAYNMTHTQNTVSFEMALSDGMMKLKEGETEVLVGAADEHIPFLENVAEAWGYTGLPLTSGVSFFVLSASASDDSLAEVADLAVYVGETGDKKEIIDRFLEEHNLAFSEIDLILSGGEPRSYPGFRGRFADFTSYSGWYPTASAFAFHYGADFLKTSGSGRNVLIINELSPGSLGLVLLKTVEA